MTTIILAVTVISMLVMLFAEGTISKIAMIVCAASVGANIYSIFTNPTIASSLEAPINPIVGTIVLIIGLVAVPVLFIRSKK